MENTDLSKLKILSVQKFQKTYILNYVVLMRILCLDFYQNLIYQKLLAWMVLDQDF